MAAERDNNPWEKDSTGLPAPTELRGSAAAPRPTGSGTEINIRRILSVWPFALICALIGLGVAWLMIRYAVPVYQAEMRLSIKEDISSTAAMPSATFNIRDPFNDKVDMMRSPTVVRIVVEDLKLHCNAISKGQLKNKDLYNVLRWQVINETPKTKPFQFIIRMNPKKGYFNWQRGALSGTAMWNQPFGMGQDSVIVFSRGRFAQDAEIVCSRADIWQLARTIARNIKLNTEPQSYSMDVSYADVEANRAVDILSKLADAYDKHTIEYKNRSLQQSIKFIQDRLDPLAAELDSLESEIVRFKTSRKMVSASTMASSYLEKTSMLDQQLAQIGLQYQILDLVQQYVNDPNTKDENLSLVGLNDSYLQGLVVKFQDIRQERDKIAYATTEENPNRILIESELDEMKDNINVQINNYRSILRLQEANVATQLNTVSNKLQNAPADEKELLEKQRQQSIKQSLYLLFLQRKEEAAITLASTTSETRVLSPAIAGAPFSPKKGQLYGICFVIGLIIPIGIALLKDILNHSITSKKQIQSLTNVPIIGSFDQVENAEDKLYIIGQKDRSALAEQIRFLRANLRFYSKDDRPLYVLITSSFSGEGKTFVSGNLAKSFALQNLKVALLEFDMRRPKLVKKLGVKPSTGLSTFLLGKCNAEDMIIKDEENINLHIFPTGIIPPNPSELMSSTRMSTLKSFLDQHYDVIIIDTPPMGLVSDAQLLTPWIDVTMLIVRFGVTPKEQLAEVEEWHRKGTLGQMAIVFNGVKQGGSYGYKYSPYYYKRKYGYEYYQDAESKTRKRSWWRSITGAKSK